MMSNFGETAPRFGLVEAYAKRHRRVAPVIGTAIQLSLQQYTQTTTSHSLTRLVDGSSLSLEILGTVVPSLYGLTWEFRKSAEAASFELTTIAGDIEVLNDTSVWVDHFRRSNPRLVFSCLNPNECLHRDPEQIGFVHLWISKLECALVKVIVDRNGGPHADSSFDANPHQLVTNDEALTHPVVLVELACGTPPAPRARTLHDIALLQHARHATWTEVMELIEARQFYGRGCGSSDLTLLASTLMSPGALLWTLDKRLSQLADELAVAYMHDLH